MLRNQIVWLQAYLLHKLLCAWCARFYLLILFKWISFYYPSLWYVQSNRAKWLSNQSISYHIAFTFNDFLSNKESLERQDYFVAYSNITSNIHFEFRWRLPILLQQTFFETFIFRDFYSFMITIYVWIALDRRINNNEKYCLTKEATKIHLSIEIRESQII